MNRREFVTLVGGAAAWPTVMRAQTRLPIVGFLCSGTTESDAFRVAAIERGLREGGFVDGVNTKFVFRYSNDHYDLLSSLLAEIHYENPSVIVLFGNAPAVVAKSANLNIPIIFAVGEDPIKMGLVSSFRRPEGNMTGVSFLTNSVVSKQLEVIHESVPSASLIGFLMNPANPNAENNRRELVATAETLGLNIVTVQARTDSELETAFSTAVQQWPGALVVEGVFSQTDGVI